MKTSKIFPACIPLIEKNIEQYICHALSFVAMDNDLGCAQVLVIKRNIIYPALQGRVTVGIFILEMSGEIPTYEEEKSFRLEWLNRLVKEYQAKGD